MRSESIPLSTTTQLTKDPIYFSRLRKSTVCGTLLYQDTQGDDCDKESSWDLE